MLPNIDPSDAFGQHPNADITSQIQETRMLFETLLSLQPQVAIGAGESREDKVSLNRSLLGSHLCIGTIIICAAPQG